MGLLADIQAIRKDQDAALVLLQKLSVTADAIAVDIHFIAEEVKKAMAPDVVGIVVEPGTPEPRP